MPPPSQQHARINLTDLKSQIVKKLGPDRANQYFQLLNRLLSHKLSKAEFDKLCYLTLGRENIHLHNLLITSILKNACHGRVPPPPPPPPLEKETLKPVGKGEDLYPLCRPNSGTIWSNGDVFPLSPRKGRSGIRDRKLKDRASPLGPNGKIDLTPHHSIATEEVIGNNGLENGGTNICNLDRLVHHREGLAERLKTDKDVSLLGPTRRPRVKLSLSSEPAPVHKVGPVEEHMIEDREEAEQPYDSNFCRSRSPSPLRAPLGIPFFPVSVGGARRTFPTSRGGSNFISSVDSGELSDTQTLRKRMEGIAGAEGLDGVSLESANMLNNGLDAYLKRLIRSCVELVGARSGHEPTKLSVYKQQAQVKLINGTWPGHQMDTLRSAMPLDKLQSQRNNCPISLLDFKMAMELNPQQLGEDWPLLLEKTSLHSFGE